jgi:hypothetical protein
VNASEAVPESGEPRSVDAREPERIPAPSVLPFNSKRKIIMKLTSIGLAAVLALSSGVAFAQTGTGSTGGTTTGSSVNGTTMRTSPGTTTGGGPNSGMTTGAGSATGGANSNLNPSGNSLINPSPSGSTLTPPPGGR